MKPVPTAQQVGMLRHMTADGDNWRSSGYLSATDPDMLSMATAELVTKSVAPYEEGLCYWLVTAAGLAVARAAVAAEREAAGLRWYSVVKEVCGETDVSEILAKSHSQARYKSVEEAIWDSWYRSTVDAFKAVKSVRLSGRAL